LSHVQSEAIARPRTRALRWTIALARHEGALALLASALLVWTAQFHRLPDFGLYEDDYFFISTAMGQDHGYLLERLKVFATLPQGRPFGFFLPDLLSFVGDKLGGLVAIYVLGFTVVTLNTFLCYRLLRVRVPVAPALVGAALFCLFPADTTKVLLTHDFQLQPSLTFALLASLAYAYDRKALAYVVAAGALLAYESGFLALFGLPLLVRRWDRSLARELARHVLILGAIVLLAVLARFVVGEVRATQSVGSVADILPRLAGSLVLGPARSLAATAYQPLRSVPTWDVETAALALLALVVATAICWRLPAAVVRWREVLEVCGAGGVMLALGYGLAFTHFPPNAIVGRGTSVHLGATLGVAVLATAIAWALLSVRPRLGAALVGAYLALAVGYYVTIDRDFVRSWQLQRAFWKQVAACCSDLQDGTVLLYELDPEIPTSFIFTNSWADPLVLREMYRFPAAWQNPPRLFSLTDWRSRVVSNGEQLQWWVPGASWDEHWEELTQGNVILVRPGTTGVERVSGSVDVAGHALRLKDPQPPMAWPPAQLYGYLLK
jgi:hypothetical protein